MATWDITTALKWLTYALLATFIGTFFMLGRLPPPDHIQSELLHSAIQKLMPTSRFDIEYRGVKTKVENVANYELTGLVVSHNDPKKWYRFDLSNDDKSINTRDLCLVNGEMLKYPDYRNISFHNDDYACLYQYKSGVSHVNLADISNNHLITDSDEIRKQIDNIRIGDQVYIKGRLVNYSEERWNGFTRKSSTTRTDTGMGACEIIFVEELRVYQSYNKQWHIIHNFSFWSLIGVLILRILLSINPIII